MTTLSDKIRYGYCNSKARTDNKQTIMIKGQDVKAFIRKLIERRTFKRLTKDEDIDQIIISVKQLKKMVGPKLT